MLVLISGANGFIGTHVVKALSARGYSVRVLGRAIRDDFLSKVEFIKWKFGDIPPESTFDGVGAVIHLAHDFSPKTGAENTLNGTQRLFRQAEEFGVKRQVFISSYSAGSHAKSVYGLTKYTLETFFLEHGGIIVRPGLVLGEAGIFGRIKKAAQKWPLIPLPDGGRGKLPVIHVEQLARLIVEVIECARSGHEYNLFAPDLVTLRELVIKAAGEFGRIPVIIPIPSSLIMMVLKILEYLNLSLPVSSDNLQGFISNQEAGHRSSLSRDLDMIHE